MEVLFLLWLKQQSIKSKRLKAGLRVLRSQNALLVRSVCACTCLENLFLIHADSAMDCENRVRELLCSLPGYQIRQHRFLAEYEEKYGKMTSYYGHSKLSGLLESFTDTLEVSLLSTSCAENTNT